MPAVRPPTLWLSVAATTISAVAVATMVMSGGPRRPLNFAGAILLPDRHSSPAPPTRSPVDRPSRPGAASTGVRATAPAPARPSSYPAPVAVRVPSPGESGVSTSARPSPSAPATSPAPGPTGQSRPPATSVPATPVSGSNATVIAQALFSALNTARAQAGLTPLSWSPSLQRSATSHNSAMAAANQLAPRTSTEPALGVRQANQGIVANFAAENVGLSETLSQAGALAVQQAMLTEQPPEDGHRQNLMSSTLSAVGIDVLLDPAHGRLWITEDFAQPS